MTAASVVRNFRSIITFIVFILTSTFSSTWPTVGGQSLSRPNLLLDAVVVFPFSIRIPLSESLKRRLLVFLNTIRILKPRLNSQQHSIQSKVDSEFHLNAENKPLQFPVNFVTAPIIAVLFLLACDAIHRREVHDGIIGSDGWVIFIFPFWNRTEPMYLLWNSIVPISIMAFFIALVSTQFVMFNVTTSHAAIH